MSGLLYVGLDYRTAPVDVRERLSQPSEDIPELLGDLCDGAPPSGEARIAEAVWLGTCNRVELYALTYGHAADLAPVEAWLSRRHGLAPETLRAHLQRDTGRAGVEHLCRVAAGLDSMILGEAQILGQVVKAHELAQRAGTAGPVLDALFRKAIECGKRARTETAIGSSAASVGYAAVELANKALGTLCGRSVLLIGAGEMARAAASNLYDCQARELLVLNRTYERAQRLALPMGGTALAWDHLADALVRADIVLCSAAAPHAIVRRNMVQHALPQRHGRPLLLIDIGVPRNVEPDVAELEGVHLYDIDDLENVVQDNLAEREAEVPRVEALVAQAVDEFMAWLASREVAPTIRELHQLAQSICDDQVLRALNRLGPLSDREAQIVRTLGQSITGKLLHQPTVQLKQFAQDGDGARYAQALRALFGLEAAPVKERQAG